MYKCTNEQMYKRTNVQTYKRTNVQTYKCTTKTNKSESDAMFFHQAINCRIVEVEK